ncbi:arginine 2-monooxygenase [Streptomyces yangpuensis]|uniref:arginine 2-monooxygenase n=1 Tax=Streptomyces yangpuensis TaxID=1648182 RepID=UPI00365B26D2|nr:arginine 2-monooxygenase [Streptomyces erythrochromogenes]
MLGRGPRPRPCPAPAHPGHPGGLPGERLADDVLRYLRSGADAGMVVPDAVDTEVRSVRVVRER